MRRRAATEPVEIAQGDEDVVSLFFSLGTQWRTHPMSGMRTGIDYAAIAPTAALMGIAMSPEMMIDLRSMEMAAIEVYAARAAK